MMNGETNGQRTETLEKLNNYISNTFEDVPIIIETEIYQYFDSQYWDEKK